VLLLGEALRRTPTTPDPYVVQAAIAACHALAPTYADTDWDALVSWYDVLLTLEPTDVVRLGRASALAERDGPEAGLVAVEAVTGLADYPWWHASRAELLLRLDRRDEARSARDAAQRNGLAEAHLQSLDDTFNR
jgi:RNA polymerase sigma-70 factor (ECF subfamily)